MSQPIRVLVLEDNAADAEMEIRELRRAGYDPQWQRVETEADYLAGLATAPELILADYSLPDFNGLRAAELLHERGLDIPFILVSGTLGEEAAVEAMKRGATDYLLKDRITRLGPAVERALEAKKLRGERRQAEEQIRLQSAALQTAANSVLITDARGIIRWVNPAFTKLTGYTAAEAIGQTPRLLKSGRHDAAFYAAFWQTITSGQPWHGEFTNRCKDGTLYCDEHTVTPVRDAAGKITHYIAILQDITGRKRAEEELRASEARYRELFENAHDLIQSVTDDGRFVYVNPAWERALGYAKEELAGLTLMDIIHPDNRAHCLERFGQIMSGQKVGRVEAEFITKTGQTLIVEVSASCGRIDETPRHVQCFFRDITERKRAEVALRASQRQMELLLQSTGEGIYAIDLEGRCTLLNRAGAEMLGWQPEEALGQNMHELVHHHRPDGSPYPVAECAIFRAFHKGEGCRVDTEVFFRKDGTFFPVDYSSHPIREDGVITGAVVAFGDSTERKRAEEALRQVQGVVTDIVNTVDGIVWEADAQTFQFTFVSRQAERILGHSLERWLKEPGFWAALVHPDDRAWVTEFCEAATCRLEPHEFEYRMLAADGRVVWLKDNITVVAEAGRPAKLRGIMMDITERKQAERRIQQLNRVYAVLSGINETIVRIKEPPAMLKAACDIAVEKGGFRLAWVGLLPPAASRLEIAAHAGATPDTVTALGEVLDDPQHGCGFTARALRAGEHGVCNDIANDPQTAPWREAALARGYHAMAALPLKIGDRIAGTFNLYAGEPGFFDDEELRLLDELAADIGFALEVHEHEDERRRVATALHDSEARFHTVWESAVDAMRLSDENGAIVAVNQAFCELVGMRREELEGQPFTVTYAGQHDPAEMQQRYLGRFRERQIVPHEERRMVWRNGKAADLEITSTFIELPGRATLLLGLFRDISARKRAEAALRDSEQKFATAFRANPSGVSLSTLDEGRFLDANDAFLKIFGLTRDETIGRTSLELGLFKSAEDRRGIVETVRRTGTVRDWEVPFTRRDGTAGHTLRSVERITVGDQDCLLTVIVDITERKQAETELRAANERYARHQAALTALTHNPAFQAGQVSEALREIAAATARALNVDRVSIWRYERDRRAIACLELYEHGEHRHSAGMILKQEDYPAYFRTLAEADVIAAQNAHHDPRTAEFSASYLGPLGIGAMLDAPVHLHGAMAGVLCCEHLGPARQWTADEQTFAVAAANLAALLLAQEERREVEEKLLRSQRMESVGALAGGIAHDLNNVLAPILMSGEILRMSIHDPGLVRVIDTITESAQRGAGMVRQVLTFSRGTADERGSVQLRHLIREMVEIAQQTFPKSIRILTETPKDTGTVSANPTKLHQVLLNLCVNARDAMPNGGTLRIAANNVRLDDTFAGMSPEARPGPYVCLTVADTGTGMTPEVRAKIFEAFFTTKEPGKGTGLGLSTVQGIVRDHGGFITVGSTPGKGTEFKIYLPAQTEAVAVPEGERPPLRSGRGELILVVDDEASIRNIATQTLQTFGYRVVSAKDGAEGLAVFLRQKDEIQLVLTDLAMPVLDGPGMIRVIRTLQPRLPVILTSGQDSQAARFDTTALDTQAFLHKPYRAEELLKALDEVLHPPPEA